MDLIFLFVILALFLLPTFFAMRKQAKAQREIIAFQQALTPGKRVITSAGIHGTVINVRDTEVDLEIGSGMTITIEKMAIVRAAGTADSLNARHAEELRREQPVADAQDEPAGESYESSYEAEENRYEGGEYGEGQDRHPER